MLIFISIFAALLSVAAVITCFLYVRKMFNAIDEVLDRILARDREIGAEITGEDRVSKLTHKASRIMDMYISEAAQTRTEKETIQGFISDMAHQMKTPLAGISMYADLLVEGNATHGEQREFFTRIKASAANLQWMMESLIKMSRLEVGAIQLTPARQSIKQTLTDTITAVLAAASKKSIDISVSYFEDMPLFHDKRWTQEAFANVIENAVKYSEEGEKIHIAAEQLPMHTKIIITDYGTGIDKNEWHKIFKRFYRGRNAKPSEGAGLGLYLVRLIMEKQGGYVMVDSVVGEYTAFSLFFQN
jgi:signal transduction histidine kinase